MQIIWYEGRLKIIKWQDYVTGELDSPIRNKDIRVGAGDLRAVENERDGTKWKRVTVEQIDGAVREDDWIEGKYDTMFYFHYQLFDL